MKKMIFILAVIGFTVVESGMKKKPMTRPELQEYMDSKVPDLCPAIQIVNDIPYVLSQMERIEYKDLLGFSQRYSRLALKYPLFKDDFFRAAQQFEQEYAKRNKDLHQQRKDAEQIAIARQERIAQAREEVAHRRAAEAAKWEEIPLGEAPKKK